jgi:hypothetical protein
MNYIIVHFPFEWLFSKNQLTLDFKTLSDKIKVVTKHPCSTSHIFDSQIKEKDKIINQLKGQLEESFILLCTTRFTFTIFLTTVCWIFCGCLGTCKNLIMFSCVTKPLGRVSSLSEFISGTLDGLVL